ncbi:MAG: RNA polymerase sigma factor [Spirochaetia bacterium]|nr:RNA polymerase sigma factor [Spirochaetia bacterium]
MDEDIKLMMELKAGNREAFNTIVEKHSKRIINYLYRFTGSYEDSQDLSQEVFIKVHNAAKCYIPAAKFTTWIYRIASNTAIDSMRKRKASGSPGSLNEHMEKYGDDTGHQAADDRKQPVDRELVRGERDDNIRQALLSLPQNQRAAIILKIYEDKSYAEIASIIGVSVPSVESLIHRARQALKTKLKNV